MSLDVKPASDYPLPDLTQMLNLSFENYLIPITFNLYQFLTLIRKDSVDLSASRVLIADDEPCGIALLARRGWTSRLAAMGIARNMRGQGAGFWFMEKLIQEARDRKDHAMVLEVIQQNEYAVRLYEKCGFQRIRKLIGSIRRDATESAHTSLVELDLREAGNLILQYGMDDLPWQLAGETIAHLTPPARAYCNGPASLVTSNPDADHVVIWSVLVEPQARGNYLSVDLLKSVIAQYPRKTWYLPAIFPEEFEKIFERAGFEKEELTQWQMELAL
jgi:GNAT superfamily N-acetyltransferase